MVRYRAAGAGQRRRDPAAAAPRRATRTGARATARRETPPARGRRAAAVLLAGLVALVFGCVELLKLAVTGWRATLAAGPVPDPAATDTLVATAAAGAAAAVCAWLVLGVLLSVVEACAAPTGRAGEAAGRWARRLAPAIVRHGVAALLGVTLGAVPLAASQAAQAAAPRTVTAAALATTGTAGSPTSPTSPASAAAAAAAAAAAGGLSPRWPVTPAAPTRVEPVAGVSAGWTPTRPQARHSGGGGSSPDRLIGGEARRPRAQAALGDEVVVRRGDTLWGLAARHLGRDASDAQIALEWPTWFAANSSAIGQDPDVLQPGTRLRVPSQHGSVKDADR